MTQLHPDNFFAFKYLFLKTLNLVIYITFRHFNLLTYH
ncbi:hypothetical protein yberc0001_32670 [Yersinia bercovieri ATCC 43970]|uniref:Uncharacterized protein n=1 Tax=Yersinia bercovieri ATCC 43970 TaxID=349968 RepID=A0ABM9XVN8_YERBE|nr:hypothetical protein yberc0001_32670 [Yersinia bercovieri ATCC 43970]